MKNWSWLLGMWVGGRVILAGSPELLREFIYDTPPPTPECHASTICETGDGLAAAWFGGTYEKHPDVGVWFSRKLNDGTVSRWTAPVELFNGKGAGTNNSQLPCWNPVLFQHRGNSLSLYYKVGPSPSTWWGYESVSTDGGRTWEKAVRLPDPHLGPIKNKPVRADDSFLLFPTSTEHDGWRVVFERQAPIGMIWQNSGPIADPERLEGIQPAVLEGPGGRMIALGRSRRAGVVFRTESTDRGLHWSPLARTTLPNPNSGVDAVTLKDGRHVLIYNHTPKGRSPLNVAVSHGDATQWSAVHNLETEPGEYSYPAVIQTSDGLVHITYTWNRKRVRHVVLDPQKFSPQPIVDGTWPKSFPM